VKSVVLVRNPTVTHLVDGDQRNVELPIVGRSGHRVTVAGPPDGNVAPPGPYMLFVNVTGKSCGKLVPSHAAQLFVGSKPWGSARLAAAPRCAKRPFRARVRGTGIDRVTFKVDGHRVRSASAAGGSFVARIDPRKLSGRRLHRLTARVEFVVGTGQRPRTLRSSFRHCTTPTRAIAQFTG
jgi:hypothetical protein